MAYHLISVGISNYSNPANNLSYPDEDAGEVSAILRHSLGASLELDVLLRSNEATQIGIRTALASPELSAATKEDTLIIFYSGHGDIGKSKGGENEAYLAPYDAVGDITISGISTTELSRALDGFMHGNKIMLLDCCYSGGANSKGISRIKHKDLKSLKAFQNQTYAEGTLVFTACKEDETAIEAHDLKHGLFTYHLIEELVKDHQQPTVALSSILAPVNSAVQEAAKKYNHVQTPTTKMSSTGSMSLPKLSKPPAMKPDIIKVPTTQGEGSPVVAVPNIIISDKKAKELVQDTIVLVENASKSRLNQIAFRSTLNKVIGSTKTAYAELPKHARSIDEVADLVTKMEGKSYQLMITAAVVGVAGNDTVNDIFAEEIADILLWKHGHGGTVAAIETSDVVFVAILYILLVCAIYTGDSRAISKLLNTSVDDWNNRGKYIRVVENYGVHYASSLGGNAKDVLTHMINLLQDQKWLLELLGVDDEKLKSLVIQANLCFAVAYSHAGERMYAAYNDHDLKYLSKLVHKIRTDADTQNVIAPLLGSAGKDVPQIFATQVGNLNSKGDMRWWSVLSPSAFTDSDTIEEDN